MRGEKSGLQMETTVDLGSPPHARGKVKAAVADETAQRITPACAGKSESLAEQFFWKKDHPRMRGEKMANLDKASTAAGSPPHAREKDMDLF